MAEISIGEYIFTRLAQLGVKTCFGVPGGKHAASIHNLPRYSSEAREWCADHRIDYELVILDMIPAAGLTWRGNANELIASYAVRSIYTVVIAYCYILI